VPTPDEVELSRVAQMVFSIPGQLEVTYPAAYGGIYHPTGANDRWVIRVVEGSPGADALIDQVQHVLAEALDRTGRTMSVEFEPTTISWACRGEVRQEIADQMVADGPWAQLGVIGVGLNRDGVHVTVLVGQDRDQVETRLIGLYPDIPFEVVSGTPPTVAPGFLPGS
jgi:hypothetical protein